MVRSPSIDKNGMKKGEWSKEEDDKLRAYINRYGTWNWRQLPRFAGLSRCGKSCRLRWKNYLQPNVKRGNFTKDEEDIIINLHNQLGKKWSVFAKNLPGRTDNEIKNYWHTHLKKRTQGQNLVMPLSKQEIKEESSRQISLILEEEDNNQESSHKPDYKYQQITSTSTDPPPPPPVLPGLTSPTESCYSSTPSKQESEADIWSQQMKAEDFDLTQLGSSYNEPSFGSSYNASFECLDGNYYWSQLSFDTDYMINAYNKYQQDPTSPSTEEVCLWSYDLIDDSTLT